MNTIFSTVLDMSLTASWVILAILVIRLLLRKAPRKYSYILWSAAAFRLCCPVSFSSVLSLFSLPLPVPDIRHSETVTQITQTPVQVIPTAPVKPISPTSPILPQLPVTAPVVTPSTAPAVNIAELWLTAATVIWCVGMAALLIYAAVSYVRLRRQLATAIRLEGNVYQAENIRSPFILGFLRPKIYIPYGLDADSLGYVLAHERTHLRRLDHMVKPLSFLLLTVHWFNPLVWLSFFLMSRDMEMSCDEAVLAREDNIRKAYSTTLLSFAANRRFPSPSPLSFGETGIRERIRNVLRWKRPAAWVTVMAVLVCTVVLIACAADPETPVDSSTPDDTPAQSTAPDAPSLPDPVPAPAEGSSILWEYNPYVSSRFGAFELILDLPAEYQLTAYSTEQNLSVRTAVSGGGRFLSVEASDGDIIQWYPAAPNSTALQSGGGEIRITALTSSTEPPEGTLLEATICIEQIEGDTIGTLYRATLTGTDFVLYREENSWYATLALAKETDKPEAPAAPDTGEDAQLRLIADSVEEWAVLFDYADDRVGYAVTDLDGNGRLEVIAAQEGGTGIYTYASFYEVNDTYTALEKLRYDFPEGHSQPDLMDEGAIPLFYGENTGTHIYVFRDWGKSSFYESWVSFWSLTLRDGEITTTPIATRVTEYHDSGETHTYTDGSGNTITKGDFVNLTPLDKTNYTPYHAAIHWILFPRDESILSLDEETLLTRLKESCDNSGITEFLG